MTMNQYQQYIHKSRYAKFKQEDNRREDWNETVQRYVDYIFERTPQLNPVLKKDIFNAIAGQHIMPSMRAMMTAGKAADRDNTCVYNCSYLPVDDVKSFDEAMFILLCGTGVGFSVESKYVNRLPDVPEKLFDSDHTISVHDSKEGWAKAYRLMIANLYAGEVPKWDVSKVRAAGTPLKTFGGRASGPEPLEDLFRFTISTFKNAQGRKLNTLECHDLMCKIGEVVVVGGVRRSAMISLSDLNDERIRHAKSGNWWETHPHRALANNSAVYNVKPTVGTFLEEWTSLYNSHSGERGIFNREAAQKMAAKYGKRDASYEFGTNPCSEIILRPYQFCNLTEVMVRPDDTLATLKQKVRIAAILGTIQATFTHFPYLRKVWQRNTEEERLLGVSLTGIYDHPITGSVEKAEPWLEALREVSNEANAEFADLLGIPRSTAITAVKPSGTVSQLTDTASGIHPRHAPYYVRRVRGDNKDPLTQFMIDQGIPAEPCVMKPNTTTVFSFPQKAPEGLVTRDDINAIQHLSLWLTYQRHWCEHKPSVTISVTEDEWPEVGAFVWKHFDEMSGVSFLPHDGGTYRQAPYEECTKDEYEVLLAKMPTLDWALFKEQTDNVEGAQMLACTAGGCEI